VRLGYPPLFVAECDEACIVLNTQTGDALAVQASRSQYSIQPNFLPTSAARW